jgi:hypothetical protein
MKNIKNNPKRLFNHFSFILFVVGITLFNTNLIAQENGELPPMIDKNTTLTPNNYVIKRNVFIKSGVTLTIPKGCNLLLGPDVTIIVAGNVRIEGDVKDFNIITSLDDDNPGNGFVIKDFGSGYSNFEYVKFKSLKKPIYVQKNWFRDSLTISNCQFKNLTKHDVSLEFQDVDQVQALRTCSIKINNNTFSNNSGGILITNIANDYLKYSITNNVISRNEYTGRESNGIFSSPLFINYNSAPSINLPVISGNSICYNYSSMVFRDTVDFFPVNITALGSAEALDLSGNYFGEKSSEELARAFDQITANQRAPFVYFNNLLKKPEADLNGHIYKINVNNLPIGEDEPYKQWKDGVKEFTLFNNKPILPGNQFYVAYHFLENDTLYIKYLEHKLTFKDDGKTASVELLDKIQKRMPNGYFMIDGLFDSNLFEVPSVSIGKKTFVNGNRELFLLYQNLDAIPKIITTSDFVVSDKNDLDKLNKSNNPLDTNFFKFKPYKEFEVFSGSSLYFGDLAANGLKFYPANARPALGLREGWHFKERLKLELRQDFIILVGDDNSNSTVGKSRGTGFARNLNVRTTVVDFAALLEWDLFKIAGPKYIIPSIFLGIQGYYYKPMGKLDGQYYDLRSIGTEGQTLNGTTNTYAKFDFGVPFGIKICKELNTKTSVAFSYTQVKLFTDYLDDVSVGLYPNAEELKKANPDLGQKAVSLSNPGNQTGRRSVSADNDGYAYYGLSLIFNLR